MASRIDDDEVLNDALAVVLDGLPPAIRDFVLSGERTRISLLLSEKYQLHADLAGAFEKAYLFLLLGVDSPKEFVNKLETAGIPHNTVRQLTEDINELVFKKLQQQVLAARPTSDAYRSPPRQPLVSTPQVKASTTSVSQPIPEAPSFNLAHPGPIVSAPAAIRTMQKDISLISSSKQSMSLGALSHPEHSTPARFFQTASIPREIVTSPSIIQPSQIAPSKPVQDTPVTPISHEYGSDPYREPTS